MVRTRFAPSPTGYMHVGGARTALFAWLVAKQAGGQFVLRLEDTDKAREVAGSDKHIMESLHWLGIEWDEGFDKGGPYGPYRQSERLDSYRQWAQKLIDTGRAYADPYSIEEVESLRQRAKAQKKPFLYRNHRPDSPPAWDGSQALRFKFDPKAYTWHDEVMGDLSASPESVDDFVIIKADGFPTYNFGHIIDDHLMKITHVTRSQEFLSSTPKFLSLYEALGIEPPILASLPYVMGPDGKKKLSKRDGAKDILDYKSEGFLPVVLVNFLATLGWNDGTEQEIFSVDELLAKFELKRVQKSGAKFDEQRLVWMNGHYIRHLPLNSLYERAGGFWPAEADKGAKDYKKAVLGLVQDRLKFLAELPELTIFFFEEPQQERVKSLFLNPPDKQLKKIERGRYIELLRAVCDELALSDFSLEDITARLNNLLEKLKSKPGVLFALTRIAVTGAEASPDIFGVLHVLGKDKVQRRLQIALMVLDS